MFRRVVIPAGLCGQFRSARCHDHCVSDTLYDRITGGCQLAFDTWYLFHILLLSVFLSVAYLSQDAPVTSSNRDTTRRPTSIRSTTTETSLHVRHKIWLTTFAYGCTQKGETTPLRMTVRPKADSAGVSLSPTTPLPPQIDDDSAVVIEGSGNAAEDGQVQQTGRARVQLPAATIM